MKVLLLAGLGPYFKQAADLPGSLFDEEAGRAFDATAAGFSEPFRLRDLLVDVDGGRYPLLRRESSGSLSLVVGGPPRFDRPPIPSLSGATLRSILWNEEIEHEYLSLDAVWDGHGEPGAGSYDCALVSTTFICDRRSLARAVAWIEERLPSTPIVVGGQYSNLKHDQVLRDHPSVIAVVRGDAELALPTLLRALGDGRDLAGIPNVVTRARRSGLAPLQYIDIERYPATRFEGPTPVAPYESMRGCPYSCKFCSFPAASPKWRFKSAERIAADWSRYRDECGTTHVRALDSTFTIPSSRFARLLEILPAVGVGWEAFTRADVLRDGYTIERLARANCRTLSIGFESMSDSSLQAMNKKVSSRSNRRAFRLLRDSPVGYRVSFMVGYPGESPSDYQETHEFLVQDYAGHFQLSVFSLQDETMPVWADRERFALRVDDDDPDGSWSHRGMDADMARELRRQTLYQVRWNNERAVPFLWQPSYQTPLLPGAGPETNYRVEKLVERLGFLPVDVPDGRRAGPMFRDIITELAALGVHWEPRPGDPSRSKGVDQRPAADLSAFSAR